METYLTLLEENVPPGAKTKVKPEDRECNLVIFHKVSLRKPPFIRCSGVSTYPIEYPQRLLPCQKTTCSDQRA